jgi:hypothetical protein
VNPSLPAYIVILRKLEKEDYSDLFAYKSITLLNILGKILKTVIASKIREMAETYELLLNT